MYPSYGMTHLQLTVADLPRSMAFYGTLFGMRELFRVGDHMVMMQTPGSHEVFTLNANPATTLPRGEMGGIAHFGFRLRERPDMAAFLADAAKLGGTAHEHGQRGEGELWGFVDDPDGYGVEVFWVPEGEH